MVFRDPGTARLLPSLKIQLWRTAPGGGAPHPPGRPHSWGSPRPACRVGYLGIPASCKVILFWHATRGDLVCGGVGNQYGKTGRPAGRPDRTREEPTMGRTAATVKPGPRKAALEQDSKPSESHRETVVETIVVALILALVVRGFEIQPFVIPTGSMAPTLMGRHKELSCPQCGFVYSVNASHEVEGPSF